MNTKFELGDILYVKSKETDGEDTYRIGKVIKIHITKRDGIVYELSCTSERSSTHMVSEAHAASLVAYDELVTTY